MNGYIASEGLPSPSRKKWYGYFRKTVIDPKTGEQKTVRIAVILGSRSHMKRAEARDALEREITKRSGQAGDPNRVMNDGSVTFGWFVPNRFLPLKEASWKEETAKVKKLLIQRDLIDPFDNVPLENFDKFTLQLHLNKLAQTTSRDRVLQMRAYLRDIFVEAVDQNFLAKDPARKVKVPAQLRGTDKTTLSWEQLRNALSRLLLRDRVLLELDMTNALRPSELFALRWRCFNPAAFTMSVTETAYRDQIRPWGKTRKSLGVVHLPKKLTADLLRWKEQCPDPSPASFHISQQKRRFHGHRQLSQTGITQVGRRSGTAEAYVSSHKANDCHLGTKERYGEGRARRAQALARRNHNRRLHARDSQGRAGDG